MSHTPDPIDVDRLEQATAARLARLRSMPIDTAPLDRLLGDQIPAPGEAESAHRPLRLRSWMRPLRAVAAGIVLALVVTAAVLLATSAQSVSASPAQMAQMHADLVAGRMPAVQVDSIDAARKALSADWPQSPALPDVPADHVMACCMKTVKDKKVACVLLRTGPRDTPVTMVVARASDMRIPRGSRTLTRGQSTYHVQSLDRLNMVTLERNDRWVCLMAEMDADALVNLASGLQF